jgi:predicted secreted protein
MPKFAATDYSVTVAGTNLSTSLNSVELALESDDLETTAFGGEWRTRISGLKTGSLTLNFMQDFGAGAVDATLYPLFGTQATVVIKPTSGSVSSTNPSYTAVCLVNAYSPFASSVGDIATLSVTWPTSGTVTRGTSA